MLVRLAPADGPAVAVDSRHGDVGPVGLEDEVGLFLGHVSLDEALLIDTRDGVFEAQGSGEVLEDPLGRSGEPGQGLLGLEVPVEEVAGVGFGPVAVFGDAGRRRRWRDRRGLARRCLCRWRSEREPCQGLRSGGLRGCRRPIRRGRGG